MSGLASVHTTDPHHNSEMLVVTHSLPTLSELLLVSVFDASVRSDAQRDETGAKVGNGCVTHFTVAAIGRPEPAPCEYGPLDCKCGDTDQSVRARAVARPRRLRHCEIIHGEA